MPQLIPGNIDLHKRPIVKNPDGSISTVRSASFQDDDGLEVLVPTVSDDGRILKNEEAWNQYKLTGKHLGKFKTVEEATKYAEQLHKDQEREYVTPAPQTSKDSRDAKLETMMADPLWNQLSESEQGDIVNNLFSVTPKNLQFSPREAMSQKIRNETRLSRDPVIDFTRGIIPPAVQGIVGGVTRSPMLGRAANIVTDVGMQGLYEGKPTQGATSQVLGTDPSSLTTKIINALEQYGLNKAMGGLSRRSFAADFPQMQTMGVDTSKLIPQRIPQPLDEFKPTTSQRAEYARDVAPEGMTKTGLGLVHQISQFLENRAAPGTKNKAMNRSAELIQRRAKGVADELAEPGINFTEEELANPAAMIARINKNIPPKDYIDVKARMSPLNYESVTRTVTPSAPIIKNRAITQTVTPSTPVTSNWVDTRIVPGPTRTGVFESPNIQGPRDEFGRFQRAGVNPDEPSIFTSRPIPGTPRTEILGKGREITGSKIGPPRTIKLGETEEITGARIGKPRTEVIGEQLIPGPGGSVKKVASGITREVPYATSYAKMDRIIKDEDALQKMLTHAQETSGNENTRRNLGSYHFMRMMQRSSVKDPKTGAVRIDPDSFSGEVNSAETQGTISKLYNARQKSDIQQFAKNLAYTQDKPQSNLPYRITAGGLTLTGLISSAVWAHPAAAVSGSAISIGSNLIGRALVNDKHVGRLLVRMAGGEPLGMPIQTAMRQILNTLNGGVVGVINQQTGKEQRARIENGKLNLLPD